MARADVGQSPDPGTPSESSTQVAGARYLGHFLSASPGRLAGNWIGSRPAGPSTGTLINDAGIAGGSLAHCVTMPAPNVLFLENKKKPENQYNKMLVLGFRKENFVYFRNFLKFLKNLRVGAIYLIFLLQFNESSVIKPFCFIWIKTNCEKRLTINCF